LVLNKKQIMKRYFTEIIVVASLFFTSSCSSVPKSGEAQVSSSEVTETPHEHSTENPHQEDNSKTATQAKLTTSKNITPNQPVSLVIDIQDSSGKNINNFDTFQEKLMHLIVVRDDLQSFDHIHPIYKSNGRFEVNATFPSVGNYTLISDYKPSGQNESVSLMKLTIPGSVPLPKNLEKFDNSKIVSNTKVNFKSSEPTVKAGKEVSLIFDLKDNANNQPIKDLQPYLGEKGHLVIIKSSFPLLVSDYIHAHAVKNTPDGQVQFVTNFPQPGTYKIWVQFNRNGKINTADFWVNAS